jgi:hypothetical protein
VQSHDSLHFGEPSESSGLPRREIAAHRSCLRVLIEKCLRGDNYDGRFSDNYLGQLGRPSAPVVGRGESPDRRSARTDGGVFKSP